MAQTSQGSTSRPAYAGADETREFFVSLAGYVLDHFNGDEREARKVLPILRAMLNKNGKERG